MAEFVIQIAGHRAKVHSLFESTRDYCSRYLTDAAPEWTICVSREDLQVQQALLDEEAREVGLKRRKFSDPFLERAVIQRKLAQQLVEKSVLLLHGSTVAVDGRAYLFTAKCGTGKSTHTSLWRQIFPDRAIMVNDDKPFLHIGAAVTAFGSPWSGKHGLDSNIAAPLQGICILERGTENRIWPISKEEAREMLLSQLDSPNAQPLLEQLMDKVPLWKMHCTKAPEAAQTAHRAMAGPYVKL